MKNSKFLMMSMLSLMIVSLCVSCGGGHNEKDISDSDTVDSSQRGEPLLKVDTLMYDEAHKTFTLELHTDSTAGAVVTYYLYDGDSLLQNNTYGKFKGIAPLEEGYSIEVRVVWEDDTVVIPRTLVSGFVIPRKQVQKMSVDELQKLINAKDDSLAEGRNEKVAQNVEVYTEGVLTSLSEIIMNLVNEKWSSVTVKEVEYDEYNCITTIKISYEEKQVEPILGDGDHGGQIDDIITDEY